MSEASKALHRIARGTGIVFAEFILVYLMCPKFYKV